MHAVDAHVPQPAGRAERDVVLADLVALRVVGIEVVLAVEYRPRRDLALERQGDLQPEADGLLVDGRKRPGVGKAHRARVDVRLVAERERAAAEHLRPGLELDVDLQPDDGLVFVRERHQLAPGAASNPIAPSIANAASRRPDSVNAGEVICRPTGRSGPPPSGWARPAGIEIAGIPAIGMGTVQ